jgi:MFS family permease
VRGLIVTGMYSTFFLATLYLEHVRHFTALQTGVAYLPWTVTVGILSLGITARLVRRFGSIPVLIAGMLAVMAGLLLMHGAGPTTPFFPTVFFAFFAIGLGLGLAFMPLLGIAMADMPAADAGLGSGIVNVSQQISGALGLAVLGTIATSHTKSLLASGHVATASLVSGYHVAFLVGAICVAVGIGLALVLLAPGRMRTASAADQAPSPDSAAEFDRNALEPVYADVVEVA